MIARALAGKPRFLVIDETLDNLGLAADDPLVQVLLDPAAQRTTLLITKREDLMALCQRTISLPPVHQTEATEHAASAH